MKKLSFICILASFLSCQKESGITTPLTDPTKDTTFNDISYGGNDDQKFDLYLPAGRTDTTPVIVLIHGGGWIEGNKNDLSFFAKAFQQKKFAVANINYRLAKGDKNSYPLQLDDIASVVNLLAGSSKKYIYSKKRFYIIGHSAGAHLSLAYAYTRNSSGLIKAAAGMATPTNLFNMAYYNPTLYGDLLKTFLGAPLSGTTTELYKNASPYYQVSASVPPTLLFQGDLDFAINKEQSQSLAAKLNEQHTPNKLIIYPLVFHDWWTNGDFLNNTILETSSWFNTYR